MADMGMPGCVEDSLETCRMLRTELQVFAQKELRGQLADLRSKVRDDIHAELEELQAQSHWAYRPSVNHPQRPPTMLVSQSQLRNTASDDGGIRKVLSYCPDPPSNKVSVLDMDTTPRADVHTSTSGSHADTRNSPSLYTQDLAVVEEVTADAGQEAKESEWIKKITARNYASAKLTQFNPKHLKDKAVSKKPPMKGLRRGDTKLFFTHVRNFGEEIKGRPSAAQTQDNHLWEKRMGCLYRFADYPVALSILLNGIFLGWQTQYQSSNMTEAVPQLFPIVEVIFCLIFTVEIVCRIARHKQKFFVKDHALQKWNTFDFALVVMQVIEVVGMFTTDHESETAPAATSNVSYLRLLRILRLFRVLRLVRLLQFISELNTIISSITNSMRSLFWTMVLLLMMIYIVGIIFTQIVFSHRMANREALELSADEHDVNLEYWFGSLTRTTLSLYEAILGGADWDSLVFPLADKISVLLAPLFILYIAFSLLAMMNVITGIFVESALKNASKEQEMEFYMAARDLFREGNGDKAFVTQVQFDYELSQRRLQAYLRQVGVEAQDAALMFTLLDTDSIGMIDVDDLLAGLLRLRSAAKVLDIALFMHESEAQHKRSQKSFSALEGYVANVAKMVTGTSGKLNGTPVSPKAMHTLH